MRGMLDGTEPSAAGTGRYTREGVRNLPGPDPGPPADLHRRRRREGHAQAGRALRGHEQRRRRDRERAAQGADPAPALRDRGPRPGRDRADEQHRHVVIRDDRAEAERVFHEAFDRNRVARHWTDQPVGTPEDVAEQLAPYLDLGYRHLIAGFPPNYDEESMTRYATEVRPLLERGSS